MPFEPQAWKYQPQAVIRAQAAAAVKQVGDQVSPLVAKGDPLSLLQAQQLAQQATRSPADTLLRRKQLNDQLGEAVRSQLPSPPPSAADSGGSLLGHVASAWRASVPQGIRDVLGKTLRTATSAEYALNELPFDSNHLGSDVGGFLHKAPVVGGALETAFDVGLSPLSLASAGLGSEVGAPALAALRAAGPVGRGVAAVAGPVVGGGFRANLAANIAGALAGKVGSAAASGAAGAVGAPEGVQTAAGIVGGLAGGLGGIHGLEAGKGLVAGLRGEAPTLVRPTIPGVVPEAAATGAVASGSPALSDTAVGAARPVEPPPPSFEPFTAADSGTTTPEQIAANAELLQQQHEQHYGGQAAGQVARSGDVVAGAQRAPDYTQTAEEVKAGNRAALERSGGGMGVNGDSVPGSTQPLDVQAPYYDAQSNLLQRIADAKPLQAQQLELNSANARRQAGAYMGALQNGPGGVAGALRARGAMRGAAARVSFQPLSDVIPPEQWDTLANTVTSHPDLRPFERNNAVEALLNLRDGTVPTPSALANLETAFPGVTRALQQAKIISPPTFLQRVPTSLTDVNNAIRSSNTFLDVAFAGRLGPQVGLSYPKTFAQAVGQAWQSVKDPEIVQRVWDNLDERAGASANTAMPLPTVDEMRADYGLKAFTSDTTPGLAGQIPGVRRVAKVYQNFMALLRPQILQEEIANRLAAGALSADQLRDPTVTRDLGRAVNLLTGASSLKIGDNANLLFEFPNWLAAQGELIQQALTSGSITGQIARRSLLRLAAFGAATTAAVNLAQGRSPLDGMKNGVPMAHVPGTDLTVDMFGPLGELLSKGIGLGVGAVQGAQAGGVGGAVGGLGKQAAYDVRSVASPLAGLAVDQFTGTDLVGRPSHNLMDMIEHVAPFNASSAITGTREPLAQGLSSAGLRVHQPSATNQLKAYAAQQNGVPVEQVTTEMLNAAKQAKPDLAAEAQSSESAQQAKTIRDANQAQQLASDQQLLSGRLTKQAWVQQRSDRLTFQRGQLSQVYGNTPITDAEAAKDPVKRYVQALQQATDPQTGAVDPVKLEQARAAFGPQVNAQIDHALGTGGTPLEQQYRKAAATYYGTPKYAGYSADEGSLIDRVHAEVTGMAQQLPGQDRTLAYQRALRQLLTSGQLQGVDAKVIGGVRRLLVGALPTSPARTRLQRSDPGVAFFFGPQVRPSQVAAVRQAAS